MDWTRLIVNFFLLLQSAALIYYYHKTTNSGEQSKMMHSNDHIKHRYPLLHDDMHKINETSGRTYKVFVSYKVVCPKNESCIIQNYETFYHDEEIFESHFEGVKCLIEKAKTTPSKTAVDNDWSIIETLKKHIVYELCFAGAFLALCLIAWYSTLKNDKPKLQLKKTNVAEKSQKKEDDISIFNRTKVEEITESTKEDVHMEVNNNNNPHVETNV